MRVMMVRDSLESAMLDGCVDIHVIICQPFAMIYVIQDMQDGPPNKKQKVVR